MCVKGVVDDYLVRNVNGSIEMDVDDGDIELRDCNGDKFDFNLEDGDLKLSESVAICRYLIEAYDGGPFWVPRSLAERTRQDEWCSYIYGEIDETSLYVMRRHRDLRAIYGGNDEVVDSAAAYLQRHLIFLEKHPSITNTSKSRALESVPCYL